MSNDKRKKVHTIILYNIMNKLFFSFERCKHYCDVSMMKTVFNDQVQFSRNFTQMLQQAEAADKRVKEQSNKLPYLNPNSHLIQDRLNIVRRTLESGV